MTDSTIDSIIEDASERFEAESRPVFERCTRRLLEGIESHPMGGSTTLTVLAAEAFDWLQQRDPDEIRIRIRNPEDRPGHTVLETLQSDRPFILETLGLVLAHFGVEERLVVHPILQVVRDESGRLLDVAPDANGEPRESYVYIEFAPQIEAPGRLHDLESHVRFVMSSLADVTEDHRRMVRVVRELNANLEYTGPVIEGGVERTARVQSFLEWVIDGRFVLVGSLVPCGSGVLSTVLGLHPAAEVLVRAYRRYLALSVQEVACCRANR